MNKKAQGTIEYLVILAVVVVIGLVVVSLLTNQTNTQNINTTTDKIETQTRGGITVTEAYTDSTNENVLVLRNNDPKTQTLKTITTGNQTKIYNTKLQPGTTNTIKLNELDELECTCEAGQTSKTCEYTITYESENGIEYNTTQTTTVECLKEINVANTTIDPEPDYFRFEIEIESENETYSFWADNADLEVKWSDTNTMEYDGNILMSHTFSEAGDYNIDVKGTASRIKFGAYVMPVFYFKPISENSISFSKNQKINFSGNEYGVTPGPFKDIHTPISAGVTGITSAEEMFWNTDIESFSSKNFFDEASKNVTNMRAMFSSTSFNQDISNWDVSNVTNMDSMFSLTNFNQNINKWNIESVIRMNSMFDNSDFNQPIGDWNTSSIEYMGGMFRGSSFNQDISNWSTSNVTSTSQMFAWSDFNQPIGDWNTSSIEDMGGMFDGSKFNQDISQWDVSNVESMNSLFKDTNFNQDISNWNPEKVWNMSAMFENADFFYQDLSEWCVQLISSKPFRFDIDADLYENETLLQPQWGDPCP
jgi:surface protein